MVHHLWIHTGHAGVGPMETKMKTQLKLTQEEAHFLCWQAVYYLNNVRADSKRAARYAWRCGCALFPRLKRFKRPTP